MQETKSRTPLPLLAHGPKSDEMKMNISQKNEKIREKERKKKKEEARDDDKPTIYVGGNDEVDAAETVGVNTGEVSLSSVLASDSLPFSEY